MQITRQRLSLEEFKNFVATYDFGRIKPSGVVIHHTWRPTVAQWKGAASIDGLVRYYEGKGWSAGPHLFIGEDGIWLFTPMNQVGIHAGSGNATWSRGGKKYSGYRGPWGSKLESYTVGLEVVGDYDTTVWSGETKKNALGAIFALQKRLGFSTEGITFHRDYSTKTCPGQTITKDWLFQQLKGEDPNKKVIDDDVSPWAEEAWNWAKENELDLTVHPQQRVTAEWIFAILKKVIKK